MHTLVDARCCCKPARPPYCLEEACHRWLQRGLGETSRDPQVDLAPNLRGRESQNGLALWKAESEALEPGASVPVRLVPEVRLRMPAQRKCACSGSRIYP